MPDEAPVTMTLKPWNSEAAVAAAVVVEEAIGVGWYLGFGVGVWNLIGLDEAKADDGC